MAATVGELVVNLVARTAKFTKGMRDSGTRVSRFTTKVGAAAKKMAMFGASMAGIASVGGLAVMIKRNLELMDSTAKLADRIGITTEALTGLRHAAELTGAGTDTLDAGLTTMAKRLGEAARGAGAAVPALKLIGLEINDIIALSPDQQFIAIAEAISKLPTATERAAAAANIFSKGNMGLINTLAEGRKGIEAMIRENDKLGGSFSRETAAKAEEANDAITNLTRTMSGAAVQATADMADTIKDLAEAVEGLPQGIRNIRAAWVEFAAGAHEGTEMGRQMILEADSIRAGDTGGLARKKAANRAWVAEQKRLAEDAAEAAKLAAEAPRLASMRNHMEAMKAQSFLVSTPESRGAQQAAARAAQRAIARSAADMKAANLRGILGGVLGNAGTDGFSLSGAATKGSAAAYSAIANRGLGGSRQQTEKEILNEARKRLRVQEETKRRIEELLQRMGGGDDVVREIL